MPIVARPNQRHSRKRAARPRPVKGRGSDFLLHLTGRLRVPLVLYCRESTRQQGHLADAVEQALSDLNALGIKPLRIFACIETSSIYQFRMTLLAAFEFARQHGAAVVTPSRCRFIRWHHYTGGIENALEPPTVQEYEELLELADGVPLATLVHPDQSGRPSQTARGIRKRRQQAEPRRLKRRPKDEMAGLVMRAIQLREAGKSWPAIQRELGVAHSVLRYHIPPCKNFQSATQTRRSLV